MRCAICQREYSERLPYCSDRCATIDRDYVQATAYLGGMPPLGSAEASYRAQIIKRLNHWNARQADPVAPHKIDWTEKLRQSPSMQYRRQT